MEMKEPKKMSDDLATRITTAFELKEEITKLLDHNDRLKARVKELEHDINRHIKITSEQANEIIALQHKLEVARDAAKIAIDELNKLLPYLSVHNMIPRYWPIKELVEFSKALTATSTDASDKITLKEFLSSNMMLGDEKAEEIITSTDTSTKESEG